MAVRSASCLGCKRVDNVGGTTAYEPLVRMSHRSSAAEPSGPVATDRFPAARRPRPGRTPLLTLQAVANSGRAITTTNRLPAEGWMRRIPVLQVERIGLSPRLDLSNYNLGEAAPGAARQRGPAPTWRPCG